MSGHRLWLVYGALLAIALAAALATQGSRGAGSPIPRVDNPGPAGAQVLYTYLSERGLSVTAGTEPLDEAPAATTLVLAAPTHQALTQAEVDELERFVRAGGTLVYLAHRKLSTQPNLTRWLSLEPGPERDGATELALGDLGGVTVDCRLPGLVALGKLRLSSERGLAVGAAGALSLTRSGDLWRVPLGRGEVWVGAGADLAESRRLDLADNLLFWEHLAARGPLHFLERHHLPPPQPPGSLGLLGLAAQLTLCGLLFVASRAPRLGPPRPEPADLHRSSREYLDSLANLTRHARVERELVAQLAHRLRALLSEKLGIPVDLGADDAVRKVARLTPLRADDLRALLARLAGASEAVPPHEFLLLSRQVARVERVLSGQAEDLAAAGARPR